MAYSDFCAARRCVPRATSMSITGACLLATSSNETERLVAPGMSRNTPGHELALHSRLFGSIRFMRPEIRVLYIQAQLTASFKFLASALVVAGCRLGLAARFRARVRSSFGLVARFRIRRCGLATCIGRYQC